MFEKNKVSPLVDPELHIEGSPSQVVRERIRRTLGKTICHDSSLGIAVGWTYASDQERKSAELAFINAGPAIDEQIKRLGESLD